jgi:hypothetical protein
MVFSVSAIIPEEENAELPTSNAQHRILNDWPLRRYEDGGPGLAIYGDEHEAFIEIETCRIIYGYVPATALRLVQLWTDQHRNELRESWNAAIQLEPLGKIAPLE